jgi:hypothetical protein
LKAAADDVVEQHFYSDDYTEVSGKWDGELEENRRRLAFKHEDCDSKVNAKANCCCTGALEKKHVEELPESKCFGHGFDTGEGARGVALGQAPGALGHMTNTMAEKLL